MDYASKKSPDNFYDFRSGNFRVFQFSRISDFGIFHDVQNLIFLFSLVAYLPRDPQLQVNKN